MKKALYVFLVVFFMGHYAYGSDNSSNSGKKIIEDIKSAGKSVKNSVSGIKKTGENVKEGIQDAGKKIKKAGGTA